MRRLLTTTLLISFASIFTQAQTLKPFKTGDKVAFLGNSITEAGFYESDIQLYYMTHFPNERVEIYNAGIGGDVAGQMNERFEDDILRMQANIVVLTFGMNDTGYFEFLKNDAEATAKERVEKSYKNFLLLEQKFKNHPEIKPVIMSSSPYDETAKIKGSNNFLGKSRALESIVAFQKSVAEKNKWPYIDLYYPMQAITQHEQKLDSTYTITGSDRIHPGKPGHLIMAALFLKNQGLANKVVADIIVDARTKRILKSENANTVISEASKNAISVSYTAKSLPFPIDSVSEQWGNPHTQSEALKIYPFIKEFNQELLTVKNLNKGDYDLLIDGQKISSFSADSLQKGINLALMSNTPQYKQAKNIMFLNDQRAELEGKLRNYYWVQFNYFRSANMLFEDSQKSLDAIVEKAKTDIFVNSKMGVYQTARFPEVRKMWEANIKTLISEIYKINQPIIHTITVRSVQKF
ncbi:lysophospholipase L1-like esterase [Pedobacter sp. UYEF25]